MKAQTNPLSYGGTQEWPIFYGNFLAKMPSSFWLDSWSLCNIVALERFKQTNHWQWGGCRSPLVMWILLHLPSCGPRFESLLSCAILLNPQYLFYLSNHAAALVGIYWLFNTFQMDWRLLFLNGPYHSLFRFIFVFSYRFSIQVIGNKLCWWLQIYGVGSDRSTN